MSGFEPPTVRLRIECSTTELHRHSYLVYPRWDCAYPFLAIAIMPNSSKRPASLSPEKYERLKAEAKAPYKGLRKFIYLGLGASGFIGAIAFLAQLAAGREVGTALPNFALQVGLTALMIGLFRLESREKK